MDANAQIEKIKEAFKQYEAGEQTTKDLLQYMKESSAWLTEKINK
ncbi:hypothetical protein [Sulfurimonas marina]|nr:hypothetical protein [Sulfurimonas marina]